jgi:hypothetical protein
MRFPEFLGTPLYVKKQQRINDQLHDKISILKAQAHSKDNIKQIENIRDSKIIKGNSMIFSKKIEGDIRNKEIGFSGEEIV